VRFRLAPTAVLWPLAAYAGAVVVLVASMVLLSYALGERHREPATNDPYEGGLPPTGSARARIPVTYYLVAMIFVIFDLEVAFLYPWAVAAREL